MNLPICVGMLLSPPTMMNTAIWQTFNQTYNAGVNYGNRNGSTETTNKDIALSYFAAVGISVIVGIGLRAALAKRVSTLNGGKLYLMNSAVSYTASAIAGFSNLVFMRRKEFDTGINLTNEEGDMDFGNSRNAASKAVISTGFTRVVLAAPPLILPGVIFYSLDRMRLLPKNNKVR